MIATISNSKFRASINSKGAELNSLQNSVGTEYIWEGNPEFWGKHSPVLFPIVGTLKNNEYQIDDQKFALSRHGFARDMEFEIKKKSDDQVLFSLVFSEETLKLYPFRFELQLLYSLTETGLEIHYRVINLDQKDLLFSLGAHPAFALNGTFSDYSIAFENDRNPTFYLLENDLLSDKTEQLATQNNEFQLNYSLFERDALIFKNLKSKSVTILKKAKPFLKIDLGTFPHLGIWTKTNAPFLCIEPWFGYSDAAESNGDFSSKEGIQILPVNAIFESKFTIEIL